MIIFTSICGNYIPKAKSLAQSVKQHIPDATFVLSLLENEIPDYFADSSEFDRIILAKDSGFSNFNRFIFKHTIVEASTAVKAQVLKHLLEVFPDEDKFIYLDPDILVYSDFVELREALDNHSIIVCPHLLNSGNVDMEVSCLQHGVYNLGFLALARGQNANAFLDWWAERLFWFCFDDMSRGIFTDQKWVDLAPSFFDVYIFKHHGYDFATWSLKDSIMSEEDGSFFVDNQDLRFIHFSGIDSGTIDWAIEQWLNDQPNSPFRKLYREYTMILEKNGQSKIGKAPWSYNSYQSGKKVSNRVRRAIRNDYDVQFSVEDPFLYSNFHFFRKLLISKTKNNVKRMYSRFNSLIKRITKKK